MATRKLLDQVSDVARFRHLSLRTEEAYRSWIKRFILFHGKRHPLDLDAEAALALAQQHNYQCFIGRNNRRPDRIRYIVQYWK